MDETGINLTVISPSQRDEPCQTCGETRLLFHCHCFREPLRPIADLCKSCTIRRADGEEHVWLKTTSKGLREVWARDSRRTQSLAIKNARTARLAAAAGQQ